MVVARKDTALAISDAKTHHKSLLLKVMEENDYTLMLIVLILIILSFIQPIRSNFI